jgi:hypothetical protein
MTGVNSRPLPLGEVTAHANRTHTIHDPAGRQFEVRSNGSLAAYRDTNSTAAFHLNGRLARLHTAKLEIRRTVTGARTVVLQGNGKAMVVSHGGSRGYVQREVTVKRTKLLQRTYLADGVTRSRLFRTYTYKGREMPLYISRAALSPAFYGWAYYPWKGQGRITYTWTIIFNPASIRPSGYFSFWPVYSSPVLWLADYILAAENQDNTAASGGPPADIPGASGASGSSDPNAGANPDQATDEAVADTTTPITSEMKQAIADEVQQQLARDNAAGQNPSQVEDLDGLQRVLRPGHVFVVDEQLSVVTPTFRFCDLSPGAVLTLKGPHDDGGDSSELLVSSSRAGECPAGMTVIVALDDLQEMQNSFRADLDSGLQTLYAQQGKNGLPAAPKSALLPPPEPAQDQPPAQSDVEEVLTSAEHEANKAESNLTETAFASETQK